jgi:hypothetical protein
VDIAVLAEPDELDKGAIVHDHGGSDAFRRRPGRIDDFLALESSLEVVDFECHMGHGLDELGQGTGLLEPHPLHAVRAGTETRHVEAILSEMSLSWVLDVGGNADVVIAPATLRYRGWGLMAEPAVRRWVLGARHWGDSHGCLFRFLRTRVLFGPSLSRPPPREKVGSSVGRRAKHRAIFGVSQEEREKLPFVPPFSYAEKIVTPFLQIPLV